MESWKEELYHYGIEGMRWGVRRYQYEDGTLTDEGKRRYRDKVNGVANNVEDYAVSRKQHQDAAKLAIKKTVAGNILGIAGFTAATVGNSLAFKTGSTIPTIIGVGMDIAMSSVGIASEISGIIDGVRAFYGGRKVRELKKELAKSGIDATTADKLAKKYIKDRGHTDVDYYKEYKKSYKK